MHESANSQKHIRRFYASANFSGGSKAGPVDRALEPPLLRLDRREAWNFLAVRSFVRS